MHSLLLVVLFSFPAVSRACIASGICGATGGCGYAPPQPPPMCSGGCGSGYSCGQYGCYRSRMHSSKTLKIDGDVQEDLPNLSPNEKFERCCLDRQLPDECLSKCSFDTYTKESLRSMYFKMDKCPQQAAADIHFCAAQGRDHTECCKNNAVGTTLAGNKCLLFCDQTPGRVTQLDVTYIACYHRFDQMKNCFINDITKGKGANLPPVSVPVEESADDIVDKELVSFDSESHPAARTSAAKTFKTAN